MLASIIKEGLSVESQGRIDGASRPRGGSEIAAK